MSDTTNDRVREILLDGAREVHVPPRDETLECHDCGARVKPDEAVWALVEDARVPLCPEGCKPRLFGRPT